MNKAIASIFGVGYIKGGGTVAAVITCAVLYLLWQQAWFVSPFYLLLITILITVLGIYVGNVVEADWGKDSSRVVIDEVAGMLVTMLFIPQNIYLLIAGLVLFRFFDIVKPLYIRRMEDLPGGTGVMLDDVLAGIYANVILQAIAFFIYVSPF
ncbi:phosphatidylglycerophosphatase A family protein [Mucilaginibacter glaciei]|uniref:Phosphatidylglycerophosphatase A n=1 Tax=Mucilaginibacter glaciei TaxID=2772109 RepID=A0A926S2N6_9SPHI|nr:phosphatidylglycerophosphatase A [Mucilaginibacter glaciei]MBD1395320.1 phosphatidylglycerophosphatase A [Mucilaginibacter glaciei]